MQVAFRHPDAYLAIPDDERDQRCWGQESTDFLQIDRAHNFIRGILPIPIQGYGHEFASYGVWAEVSERDLHFYVEHFRDDLTTHPSIAGTVANEIRGYEHAVGLEVSVAFGDTDTRPRLTVVGSEHQLAADQVAGISEQQVYDALHRYGIARD